MFDISAGNTNYTGHNFIWCLFELQTDMEEEKAQEITKLQDTMREMQIQVDEANARVIKEREEAQKAIEEAPPIIKETPVIVQDTEKVESLTAEVESLKVSALTWMIMVAFAPICISFLIIRLHLIRGLSGGYSLYC